MIENITFSRFCDGFSGSYKNNFSYDGKRELFDYLTELEDSTGELIEFDPIALCCEYTEYEDFTELQKQYEKVQTMKELEDNTQVIPIKNSDKFIIANY